MCWPKKSYRRRFKRLFDIFFALAGLILASPLMVVLAVVCAAAGRGWPLFFQTRAGCGGQAFTMVKFRTMSSERGADGRLLPDSRRTRRVGRWLRSTSLDELPQMWNVLRGQMSFVGPRPLPASYLPLYDSTQARRHEIRPGLTGLAQVSGRNALGWNERLALDVWYVDNVNFLLDARIALMTIAKIIRREGVNNPPSPPRAMG